MFFSEDLTGFSTLVFQPHIKTERTQTEIYNIMYTGTYRMSSIITMDIIKVQYKGLFRKK